MTEQPASGGVADQEPVPLPEPPDTGPQDDGADAPPPDLDENPET